MIRHKRREFVKTVGSLGLLGCGQAIAQTLSGPALSFLVPQPAGNPTDAIARRLQASTQRELAQPLVVENIPGAGGSLGVNRMLASQGAPVLLIASQTESILTPLSVRAARYSPESLRPVLLVTRGPYVLVGRVGLAANSFGDLIESARSISAKPLSHGHIGNGSMIHLLGERLSQKAGISLNQVPYKGVPPVIQDIVGGQIDLAFVPQSSVRDLAASGKLKVFASTSATASEKMPKVPPISKFNVALSDFVYGTWAAVFVRRSLREDEALRLHKALTIACHEPQFQSQTVASGGDPSPPMTLAELEQFFSTETRLYQSMAREIGIQPE